MDSKEETHCGRYRTIAFVLLSIVGAISLTLFCVVRAISTRSHVSRVTIRTAEGAPLRTFFQDLPPSTIVRDKILNARKQEGTPCEQQGILSKVLKAMRLDDVVYAQAGSCDEGSTNPNPCVGCNRRVTSVPCFECGSGNHSLWQFDIDLILTGTKRSGSVKCGSINCGCNDAECTNTPSGCSSSLGCVSDGICNGACSGWTQTDFCTFPGTGCASGWNRNGSGCCCPSTPIVVDVNGNGIDLSDATGGVHFDVGIDGRLERVAWTKAGSDDAWLVLDRNNNGSIDNGSELFGNYTPQSPVTVGEDQNGFRALAEYDKSSAGGNEDGSITIDDRVFTRLRLWQDRNHNGIAEATELLSLQQVAIRGFDLDYKISRREDAHGNQFRYRARVFGREVGKWAWDVILMTAPSVT